ncbi:hypothetical protein GCM10023235_75480 [Kitasatospora terrestris]|uniref:Uncharacterized protein n=1 Tax=Kitasatospora terrestris TaxID=258051 RepID=A0ABP9EQN2_9ACTN
MLPSRTISAAPYRVRHRPGRRSPFGPADRSGRYPTGLCVRARRRYATARGAGATP